MSLYNEITSKIRADLERKMQRDIIALEDEYYYFFGSGHGALSASELRMLADILDDKNTKWGTRVKEDLGYHE